ncbi:elongator complex protein 1 [Anthonomus grandis grandis]|uniref:elongator complex protein 1 n=1 Tax=Anthonomus grandis grandis TaxID=2921223 RepID=UPI00216505FC|nr:elongator complex protein 1 [Anthonomus grandis grandis]
MENLLLMSSTSIPHDIPMGENPAESCYINDSVCVYVSKSNQIEILRLPCMQLDKLELPPEVPIHENIIHLSYAKSQNVLHITTDFFLIVYDFRDSIFSVHKTDLKSKIIRSTWNPLGTHLILITENENIYSYSCTFSDAENKYKFHLSHNSSLDSPVPSTSHVGWGAYSTQFKGIKKVEKTVTEIPQAYEKPVISWRNNGEMFVVNYWCDNRRLLKVFDNECNALYCSDHHVNLLPPVAFKPMGNAIATCSLNGDIPNLVISEKNCLIRFESDVPDIEGDIKNLKYHPDKALLAVHSATKSHSQINIYYYANDLWYLKQQLNYLKDDVLLTFDWGKDTGNEYELYVLTTNNFWSYKYEFDVYGASNQLAAVINGRKVHLTNFHEEIVPPPKSSVVKTFSKPVNQILYFPLKQVYGFVLSDDSTVHMRYVDLVSDIPFDNSNDDIGELDVPVEENSMSTFKEVVNGINYKFHLNNKGELLINDTITLLNINSIYVTENYLLLVKTKSNDCKLYCVRLTDAVKNFNCFALETCFSRNVEHGAKIVGIKEKQFVVLLMPRGNFETVTCRLIDIDLVEQLIGANKWDEAIDLIKIRKLDWNLLIDLSKYWFLEHVKDFIEAADRCLILNTIVSDFKKDNCLESTYHFWKPDKSPKVLYDRQKLDARLTKELVFKSVLMQLVLTNLVKFMPGIIKMQIKHFSLKGALSTLNQIYRLGPLYHKTYETGLKIILQQKDQKEVIGVAASLFDVSFLEFLYSQCAEDPFQYKDEITSLTNESKKDEISLRTKMSMKGNNPETTTRYLVRNLELPAKIIEDYIRKHKTARAAYDGLPTTNKYFQLISKLYASELSYNKKNMEAGMILERAGLYKEALICYKLSFDWQRTIGVLSKMDLQHDLKLQIYVSMAKYLEANDRIDDAAMLLERFVGDVPAACKMLLDHYQFKKASFLLIQHGKQADINTLLKPALLKFCKDVLEKVTYLIDYVSSLTDRLETVRDEKISKYVSRQSANQGYDVEEGTEELGNDSEYGSVASSSVKSSSRASKSSTTSSRNRRKKERKKTDLKMGGTYEDIAIIRELYIMMSELVNLGGEIHNVCNLILDEDHYQLATELQGVLRLIHATLRENIPKIWSEVFMSAELSNDPKVLGVVENRCEIDEICLKPPKIDSASDWFLCIYPSE